jgi:hypothetical protein
MHADEHGFGSGRRARFTRIFLPIAFLSCLPAFTALLISRDIEQALEQRGHVLPLGHLPEARMPITAGKMMLFAVLLLVAAQFYKASYSEPIRKDAAHGAQYVNVQP